MDERSGPTIYSWMKDQWDKNAYKRTSYYRNFSNYIAVAALDLGTANSGYAFSFRREYYDDPFKIHLKKAWNSGIGHLCSLKTPTCVLLDKNKEFKEFGYTAEEEFADICLDKKQDDYYFFRGFYINENTKDTMLTDVTGKCLPANHVVTVFIKAFVSHLIECLHRMNIRKLEKFDIRWIITVSKYSTNNDQQFLISCAEQAGIYFDQLYLVPKEDAAFICCRYLPDSDNYQRLKHGNDCMVVRLGGCSVDITVLALNTNGEIYRKTGNNYSCTSLDDSFSEFLDTIFGSQFMPSLRKEDPYAVLYIERQWELIKRRDYGQQTRNIYMTIQPIALDSFCTKYRGKNLEEVISSSIYGNGIKMRGDKMRISKDIIQNLFKPTIDKIINLIEKEFAENKDAHTIMDIVVVGGFSECSSVQDKVSKTFSNKNIIIPEESGLAVIKGALIYGHQIFLIPTEHKQISSSEMKAAQSTVTKCIFCDNPGVYHCTECKSAFCQLCRTNHDKLPTTRNHTVTDLKKIDPSSFSTNAICVSHKLEFIYFCKQCHVLICGKCVTTDHKAHAITDIETFADDCRRSAEGNISNLKIAVTKLSKAVQQMKDIDEANIKRSSEAAVAEIGEAVQKITKSVSFTKENKLYEVQSQLDIEIEEFQYNLKNKEWLYEQQKNIYESLERLMHVSHDITFITSYETLKRDIHDISDFVGERGQEKVYKIDKRVFVQEVVNAIVSDFEMSLVGKEDGSVVLMHKTDIKKKEKETKQK